MILSYIRIYNAYYYPICFESLINYKLDIIYYVNLNASKIKIISNCIVRRVILSASGMKLVFHKEFFVFHFDPRYT